MRGLHFFAFGGLLFAVQNGFGAFAPHSSELGGRPRIVITAARRQEIRRQLANRPGRVTTADDERAQLDRAVEEEILYREAVARGLDRDDPVVRERVVQSMRLLSTDTKEDELQLLREGLGLGLDRSDVVVRRHLAATMRLLTAAPVRLQPPSDAELSEVLAGDADRFRLPATTSITHVFVSRERDADGQRALRLRDTLRTEHVDPADAPLRGDPFLLGFRMNDRTDADLDAQFGAGFAAAVAALPAASWGGPIASSYGNHLVWVHARTPGGLPSLDVVRSRVVERAYQLRAERRLHEWLAAQRDRYEVHIEDAGEPDATLHTAALPLEALSLPRPAAVIGD